MPRYRHPRVHEAPSDAAVPRIAVDVNGDHVPLDADGCFEAPASVAADIAAAHGLGVDVLRVDPPPDADPETCDVIKDDGEVCGRDRPCRYHD